MWQDCQPYAWEEEVDHAVPWLIKLTEASWEYGHLQNEDMSQLN